MKYYIKEEQLCSDTYFVIYKKRWLGWLLGDVFSEIWETLKVAETRKVELEMK